MLSWIKGLSRFLFMHHLCCDIFCLFFYFPFMIRFEAIAGRRGGTATAKVLCRVRISPRIRKGIVTDLGIVGRAIARTE